MPRSGRPAYPGGEEGAPRGGRAREQSGRRGERSPAPTDDGNREGGRGNNKMAAVHKDGKERRFGATPATATPPSSSRVPCLTEVEVGALGGI